MRVNPMPAAAEANACSSSMMHAHKSTVLCSGGPKRCNCKKSKCLKLYCDCFAAGVYCQNCSCSCCLNTEENKYVFRMTVYMLPHAPLQNCILCTVGNMFFVLATYAMHPSVWQSQECDPPGKAKSVINLDADMSAVYVTGT